MKSESPEPKVPPDLRKVLATASSVEKVWNDLTPLARRDFIGWVESARQPETRKRRIERVPDMLVSGKRRPCCYAIVPMNLYKALGALPKAKARWRELTSSERRDFASWIESAKQPDVRKQRVEKVCAMLLSGKRHP